MKNILRLAIGAAVAGALVSLLLRQRSRLEQPQTGASGAEDEPPRTGGFTIEELAGESREWGGGGSGLNS